MLKPMYAILIDGAYMTAVLSAKLKRAVTADDVAAECARWQTIPQLEGYELLRIYFYDAFVGTTAVQKPVSGEPYNLADTERFRHAQSLFDQLVLLPNMSLRMGRTDIARDAWRLKASATKQLLAEQRALTDEDFFLDMGQKGVDMRIGMDMARLALRSLVRTVVVVTGDSDFVPALKFVRREGVKVILEPYGNNGRKELRTHADIVVPPPAKEVWEQLNAAHEARVAAKAK
jgi:uncharacterized LabA/DUF88 family protein